MIKSSAASQDKVTFHFLLGKKCLEENGEKSTILRLEQYKKVSGRSSPTFDPEGHDLKVKSRKIQLSCHGGMQSDHITLIGC